MTLETKSIGPIIKPTLVSPVMTMAVAIVIHVENIRHVSDFARCLFL